MLQDASSIIQNGRSNMLILSSAKSCNTMQLDRVYLPNLAGAMQNERFYLQNAGWRCKMLNILHIPRELFFCFLAFLALMFLPVFFLLGLCKALIEGFLTSWLCWWFTATNTSIRKSQTLPTPKQWPHHTTNRQQPTTNNVLQKACQTQDSSSKMLLIASNMEDSSSKMLRSSSKMLQIACQMKYFSSKRCKYMQISCKMEVLAPKCYT